MSTTDRTETKAPAHKPVPVTAQVPVGTQAPASSRPPEAAPPSVSAPTLEPLLKAARTYLPPADIKRIRAAYRLADQAHLGQYRTSGDPYISHPIAVALICTQWRLDADALMAALMHDVLEDTGVTKAELIEQMGPAVAEMVDGLSKLDKIKFGNREQAQAESFRKMLLAMARDVRVILVKLADRLHNMRTLDVVPRHKQRRIAVETMEIYAPIANRLGLNSLYRELQDLSFSYLYPMRHEALAKAVQAVGKQRREAIGRVIETVEKALTKMGVSAEISSREKSLFSIFKKMTDKRISFSEVSDLFGIRLIVPDLAQCYLALGALHGAFKPNTSRFKDFIAIPKANGYQSLHTTVMGPHGGEIEFQIRTPKMHHLAESGVAAHWLYKNDSDNASDVQLQSLDWLKSLLDIQQQTGDSMEFIDHVKVDLYPDAVYVFTPKGQIRGLPRGATLIDFAYSVHTDVGNQTVAARINGELVPLSTELKHGDVIEVITDAQAKPSPAWLGYARTGKARSEIRYFLRRMKYGDSVALGRRLLEQSLAALRIDSETLDPAKLEKVARDTAAKSVDDMLADIGLGLKLAPVVARSVALELSAESPAAKFAMRPLPIVIHSVDGISMQCAQCCHPLPGDRITGHMRGGHGLLIHRAECESAKRQMKRDAERWIDLEWGDSVTGKFRTVLVIQVNNEMGLLGRIAGEISRHEANILQVAMDTDNESYGLIKFTLQIRDRVQLAEIYRSLRRLQAVKSITRS